MKIKIVKSGHVHAGIELFPGDVLDVENDGLSDQEIEFIVGHSIGIKQLPKTGKSKLDAATEEPQGEPK